MHKLEKLILESYGSILREEEDSKTTLSLKEIPDALRKSIEKRYGVSKYPEKDFLSSDLQTYFKTVSVDNTTGTVGHKPIALPSFEGLYTSFSGIVADIKKLMNNKDVRSDKNARELFELIKTNFRKLQGYLRTERPDQYELMKLRRTMQESVDKLKNLSTINESLLDEVEEEPQPEQEPEVEAPKETVLEDSTDIMLSKFPSLKQALIKLQTEDFKQFVTSIDWISPRPSSFRINLKNGQDYILKWTGETFEAQILGKRYFLNKINDYQQALDKLSILYKEGPMKGAGDDAASGEDVADASTGGGDFPGEEGGGGGTDDSGGDDLGDEGGEDLSDEPVDFEAGEEPEA
jgi:hypothetical protein